MADAAAMPMAPVPIAPIMTAAAPPHLLDGALVLGIAAYCIAHARLRRGLGRRKADDNGRACACKRQQ
jgi:hypothetical protein